MEAKNIAALRRQIRETKNETLKKALKKKIERLQEDMEAQKMTAKDLASSLFKAKSEIDAMSKSDFNALIKRLAQKPEYSFLKSMTKSEIKDDLDRKAKPVGWRFKGRGNYKTPSKKQVVEGKKTGDVYYENRRMRSDVSKVAQLAKGGEVESGLYVTGRTKEDNSKIGEMIEEQGFHAEWNAKEGYWFFEEETDLYDSLEQELEKQFADYNINARFEGVFKKGGNLKSKAKYVPNRMIQAIEVERKGKITDIDGADIIDGVYVKKGVKFKKGGSLIGKQKNLDRNKNGKIDSEDLKMIRENKMATGGEVVSNYKQHIEKYKTLTAKDHKEYANKFSKMAEEAEKVNNEDKATLYRDNEYWHRKSEKEKSDKMETGGTITWVDDKTRNLVYQQNHEGEFRFTISGTISGGGLKLRVEDYATDKVLYEVKSTQKNKQKAIKELKEKAESFIKKFNDQYEARIEKLSQRKMATGGEVGGIKSNIEETWDTMSVIISDIKNFLISAEDAAGENLSEDIIEAIEKGIMQFKTKK